MNIVLAFIIVSGIIALIIVALVFFHHCSWKTRIPDALQARKVITKNISKNAAVHASIQARQIVTKINAAISRNEKRVSSIQELDVIVRQELEKKGHHCEYDNKGKHWIISWSEESIVALLGRLFDERDCIKDNFSLDNL